MTDVICEGHLGIKKKKGIGQRYFVLHEGKGGTLNYFTDEQEYASGKIVNKGFFMKDIQSFEKLDGGLVFVIKGQRVELIELDGEGTDLQAWADGIQRLRTAGKHASEEAASADAADADGPAENLEDYARAGRELLAREPGRYDALNPLWQHPATGALLYVGGEAAAASSATLSTHRIRKIVYCQEEGEGKCYFEEEPEFEYLRFPIGQHRRDKLSKTDPQAYFTPLFRFVERHLGAGNNVLIHCLAGAHRAGTAGVACLMHFSDLDAATATQVANRRRPAIRPIGGFPELLLRLETARAAGR